MRDSLQQFDETQSGDAFSLQNGKLLKVRLSGGSIQAKKGSMVAYQGDVKFEAASSGGLGRLVKKMATGEGQSLMKMSGTGEVFLADTAQDVHLVHLDGDKLTVNGPNLLAFDADIDWDIERVQGAGMATGGLFNTTLQGTGFVALLTDGPPVRLDVGAAPTFADAQAAVAWSGGVQTSIKTDMSGGLGSMLRGGSGEAFQMAFGGQGWVLVQPSEGRIEAVQGQGGGSGGGLGRLLQG
jgi:uncharacterized protein (AIM24 family)